MKLSKKLFYLIAFLIPLNLGKHFILKDSFVDGLLIDYLIPTIYVQDILIFGLILTFLYETLFEKNISFKLLQHKNLALYYFFLFSLLLSVLVSPFIKISLLSFCRTFLYFLFFLYTCLSFNFEKDFNKIANLMVFSFFLVSLLGILQFIKHSSVFNNYLFFGEQPYSLSTRGIRLENVLGFTVVPSYGLFRHPNIFGGLLSILLIWIYSRIKNSKIYLLYFFTMTLSLLFTFSIFSYISFLFGLICYTFLTSNTFLGIPLFVDLIKRKYILLVVSVLFVVSLLFPYFSLGYSENVSFTRRSTLLIGTYQLLDYTFCYGVGFNSFTYFIEPFINVLDIKSLSFIQPVHNLFILVLAESGVVSFLFLMFILTGTLFGTRNIILFVSLVQLIFLSFFDHYFWTIHQSHLFLWLLLGMCWTTINNYSYNE